MQKSYATLSFAFAKTGGEIHDEKEIGARFSERIDQGTEGSVSGLYGHEAGLLLYSGDPRFTDSSWE